MGNARTLENRRAPENIGINRDQITDYHPVPIPAFARA